MPLQLSICRTNAWILHTSCVYRHTSGCRQCCTSTDDSHASRLGANLLPRLVRFDNETWQVVSHDVCGSRQAKTSESVWLLPGSFFNYSEVPHDGRTRFLLFACAAQMDLLRLIYFVACQKAGSKSVLLPSSQPKQPSRYHACQSERVGSHQIGCPWLLNPFAYDFGLPKFSYTYTHVRASSG